MIIEIILGFVIGYAITPLLRIHGILKNSKMYEEDNDGENSEYG